MRFRTFMRRPFSSADTALRRQLRVGRNAAPIVIGWPWALTDGSYACIVVNLSQSLCKKGAGLRACGILGLWNTGSLADRD